MGADYALWNAVVSTVTLLVVAVAAIAAFRQLRHLRAQTAMTALLKILDDWRDPDFRRLREYVRLELPAKIAEPGFLDDLDAGAVDRGKHPELELCDWYEQLGSYLKHGLFEETAFMDVASSSTYGMWRSVEPVITRMRQTRGDTMYENFEYVAARGILFQRAHPDGCYPPDTPRISTLTGLAYGKPIDAVESGARAMSSTTG